MSGTIENSYISRYIYASYNLLLTLSFIAAPSAPSNMADSELSSDLEHSQGPPRFLIPPGLQKKRQGSMANVAVPLPSATRLVQSKNLLQKLRTLPDATKRWNVAVTWHKRRTQP